MRSVSVYSILGFCVVPDSNRDKDQCKVMLEIQDSQQFITLCYVWYQVYQNLVVGKESCSILIVCLLPYTELNETVPLYIVCGRVS